MATLAQWQAAETALLNALTSGNYVASYSIAGRNFTYRGFTDITNALKYVREQITLASAGGGFVLTRMLRE